MSSLKELKLTTLGAFVLDLGDQVLYRDAVEVAIEPKVMALLLYLYENRDRYVSIEELHQQVWSDRIVSDTAVRSAVKKLRLILGDSDIANARYVKSVSKRGYKLVCEVAPVESLEPDDVPPNDVRTNDVLPGETGDSAQTQPDQSIGAAELISEPDKSAGDRWFATWLAFAMVLAMVVGWVKYDAISTFIKETQVVEVADLDQVTSFNGEKLDLSVSSDGRYIAFSGRTSIEEDRQVYIFDRQNGTTRQLTHNAENVLAVQFAQNDKVLVYVDFVNGSTALRLLPLTMAEPEQGQITLLEGVESIGYISEGRHPSEVLFPMIQAGAEDSMLYALDLQSRQYSRLFTLSEPNEILYDVSISPDLRQLALLKEGQGHHHVVLLNLENKEQTLIYSRKAPIRHVEWKNLQTILLLGRTSLIQLDLETGEEIRLIEDNETLLRALDSHNGTDILLTQQALTRANRLYLEQSLGAQSQVLNVIDAEPQIVNMYYDDSSEAHKWVLLLHNETFTIGRLSLDTREVEPYLVSKEMLELLSISHTAKGILLKQGGKLALLSMEDRQVEYITSSSEITSDAVFSMDNKYIYYGVNVAGEWEIQSYSIETKMSALLLPKYRSIRPVGDGYIAAAATTGDGSLYYFSDLDSDAIALNHKIDFRYICRWYVRGDVVIWSTFDARKTYLHTLNWRTGEYSQDAHRFYAFYPTISTDATGSKVLALSVQINDTAVVGMTINH
ncbi:MULTISPECIES: winged helix-turn-helix domain-containing protein [unclassified Pseudoalteromonas]|uniref:winged helix-turn-helix domain-containing protein n=1 Tax=unclassified Pseudoalteromonas TaxID=194690 RepID=UPI002096F585|nr:winged helix-turn-helix domain-containing protein [Pseudoalteromonas sp. XMcav2-N]MCO7190142.1 winged helix-turn-helix domain-containing protein [Pseudoalteromonas sp. XMcav2-N]